MRKSLVLHEIKQNEKHQYLKIQSYLGIMNYLRKFFPTPTTVCDPLRKLISSTYESLGIKNPSMQHCDQ